MKNTKLQIQYGLVIFLSQKVLKDIDHIRPISIVPKDLRTLIHAVK